MKAEVDAYAPDAGVLPGGLADAFNYWRSIQGGAWAPKWSDFNLIDIGTTAIPMAVIVDVLPGDPIDFYYRFWGTANTTFIGYDCTGKSVRDNAIFNSKVLGECLQIVEERRPIVYHSKVVKPDGIFREYWRIRMPLTVDGETVSHIVSVGHVRERTTQPITEWMK